MVNGQVKVTTTDNMVKLKKQLAELAKKEVLVGIPEEDKERADYGIEDAGSKSRKSGNINNAELLYAHTHGIRRKVMRKEMQENIDSGMKYSEAHSLYIQTHGSPLFAVPPRPVIEPAIEYHKDIIAAQLVKITQAALSGNSSTVEAEMNKAGMLAVNAAQSWFENPANNWPPNSPKTIKLKGSNLPLVESNQLRKSITYVVRDKS